MKSKNKEFVVIGLGRFGRSVATALASSGTQVMVVDKNEESLHKVSNFVTYTICADATNTETIKELGLGNYDAAIIAMSGNLEASIMATILIKEAGIPFIIADAKTELEGRVLKKVGADKVVFPEKEFGTRLANQLVHNNYFEAVELSEDYSVMDIDVPKDWIGKSLKEINIRAHHGLNVIGLKGTSGFNINPEPDEILKENEVLIVLGRNHLLNRLAKGKHKVEV